MENVKRLLEQLAQAEGTTLETQIGYQLGFALRQVGALLHLAGKRVETQPSYNQDRVGKRYGRAVRAMEALSRRVDELFVVFEPTHQSESGNADEAWLRRQLDGLGSGG